MAPTQRALAAALMLAAHATAGVAPPTLLSPQVIERAYANPPVVDIPTAPIILAPLRRARRGNTKRDRKAALELKTAETFDWIGSDGTLAELTIETPGQDEGVVNLELIDDMVQKIECPAGGKGDLKIQFAQAADFDDAEDIWKWVNKNTANHFLLVVGVDACGGNKDRILFNVEGLGYVDEAETAVLKVQETTWKAAAHTFDLTVGKVDVGSAKRVRRAGHERRQFFDKIKDTFDSVVDEVKSLPGKVSDFVSDAADQVVDVVTAIPAKAEEVVEEIANPSVNPDFSIPFNNRFPNNTLTIPVSTTGLTVTATCKDCFTQGSLDVKAKFRMELLQLKEAWIEMSTSGLTAKAVIGLTLTGALTGKLAEKVVPIFKVSPGGVSIPGVLTIGPTVSASVGVELSEITAAVTISAGGSATIPKSIARLDFLNKANTKSVGWTPKLKAEPFTASGTVEAKASAFIRPAIGVEISVVESGFVAEIAANTPILTASMKAISSSNCTACGDSAAGLQGALTLGASITASLNKKLLGDQSSLLGTLVLAQTSLPLADFCEGFGPKGDACPAV
ncbi:hypothetical protein B0T14DRAFT_563267 [Immersiella caudata]|uniref:Uncharacterized protein n=1 Tax=Immersiella caudata TaxID=314043 RepID=A0AA39X532_9PEZI|nr:hypothetical protein B0T14DRAFT_563267 [Immersiella caudata]